MNYNDEHVYVQQMKEQGITDDKLQLLTDVSGAFRPGVITALVGVSGAGNMDFSMCLKSLF